MPEKCHTVAMDSGQMILAYSRLILGALAAFFAIVLWSKTRDAAWMLIVAGTVVMYVEIVYSILELVGIAAGNVLAIGSVSLPAILLPSLRMAFFIAAFMVMVVRQYRLRKF
ncbi:MAG: hypothetical protein FWG46_02710 [Treponema sp.]|nr:hypothetical protein [Treponema sp.]